nr:hypothetical protein [Paracoccus beibuensis]
MACLVQLPLPLPLPGYLDSLAVIKAIDPSKDVGGLHPENAGSLASRLPGLVSRTPLGFLMLPSVLWAMSISPWPPCAHGPSGPAEHGPMTIMTLMHDTPIAAFRRAGLPLPKLD